MHTGAPEVTGWQRKMKRPSPPRAGAAKWSAAGSQLSQRLILMRHRIRYGHGTCVDLTCRAVKGYRWLKAARAKAQGAATPVVGAAVSVETDPGRK